MHEEWQTVSAGEVQVMSAGSGLLHSEINGSAKEHLSLFQIWIMPEKQGVEPRYDQRSFDPQDRKNKLQTLVSSFEDSESDALKIHQDARLSRVDLDAGKELNYQLRSAHHGVYIMVIHGSVEVDGKQLNPRDAMGVTEADGFEVKATEASELLLIEVPMISLN